jgi:hypothetical protein
MSQAIVTKYHGPGNVRGSRVKATASAGAITLGWDDALGDDANHAAAALALCETFGWEGDYFSGGLPDGSRVWVEVDRPRCQPGRDAIFVRAKVTT